MTKKYSKRRGKRNRTSANLGKGLSNSRPRSHSFNRSVVTPILDENYMMPMSHSFNRSRVTPIFDDEIPIESPYETLSPNMFRLVYEGDLAKNDYDGSDIIDFDLPLYDSIDKPGRFAETIYQKPSNKKYLKYDEEAPNPFWSNSNDDYGQYVELSKSSSPNVARGITKKHRRRSTKRRSTRRRSTKRRSTKRRSTKRRTNRRHKK